MSGPGDHGVDADPSPASVDWTSRIAHDLRGPITPIRMAVQLLKGGRVSAAEQHEALRMIDRQLDQLLETVQDISDLIRAEAGHLPGNARPNDLNLVVDLLASRGGLQHQLAEKQQVLASQGTAEDLIATHDPARLARLLEYLVGKASVHARHGATLSLVLGVEEESARISLGGFEPSILGDADIAVVTGAPDAGLGEPGVRALLMRQFVLANGANVEILADPARLRLSLPLGR